MVFRCLCSCWCVYFDIHTGEHQKYWKILHTMALNVSRVTRHFTVNRLRLFRDLCSFFLQFTSAELIFYSFMFSVFCRKEVKDPDVLYNMLKNLLAQIKVKVACWQCCQVFPLITVGWKKSHWAARRNLGCFCQHLTGFWTLNKLSFWDWKQRFCFFD